MPLRFMCVWRQINSLVWLIQLSNCCSIFSEKQKWNRAEQPEECAVPSAFSGLNVFVSFTANDFFGKLPFSKCFNEYSVACSNSQHELCAKSINKTVQFLNTPSLTSGFYENSDTRTCIDSILLWRGENKHAINPFLKSPALRWSFGIYWCTEHSSCILTALRYLILINPASIYHKYGLAELRRV